jgi:TetR/AcrR family tetracycline transcriptional repressor
MAPQTDRQKIVDAALAILAEQGLDGVSFRNVARAVGVKAPSLYWHVANKRELLGHMSERLVREMLGDLPAAERWQDWLHNLAVTAYRHQQRTRDIQRLIIEAKMDRTVLAEFSRTMCEGLTARGFDPAHAFDAQRSVMTLATGWTMMPVDPNYPEGTPEPSFLRSVSVLIAGWEQAIPGSPARTHSGEPA